MNNAILAMIALAALAAIAIPTAAADPVDDLVENAEDLAYFLTHPYYPNCYTAPDVLPDHPPRRFCWAPDN
jgi:hypothetical protein